MTVKQHGDVGIAEQQKQAIIGRGDGIKQFCIATKSYNSLECVLHLAVISLYVCEALCSRKSHSCLTLSCKNLWSHDTKCSTVYLYCMNDWRGNSLAIAVTE